MAEYRCPACGNYCNVHPMDKAAYCPAHGWFDKELSPHVIEKGNKNDIKT
jgi:ssDNA-binding Zn-finger/Zn-ribbon topoisomerase 1